MIYTEELMKVQDTRYFMKKLLYVGRLELISSFTIFNERFFPNLVKTNCNEEMPVMGMITVLISKKK